ncbi:hypothetical protein F4556_007206 [Kitasatospora gansuensis]|uniref:MFS transporter n=1 Tax=Kitasatospora gansuensis TaxID=258050 RepID=A0A7W7SLX1_9ACTN|nr:hypothetical protein [Kitasatospora gansuensis]MBB4951671.1 hypothetical protein [Kitasatospora gansuensis]
MKSTRGPGAMQAVQGLPRLFLPRMLLRRALLGAAYSAGMLPVTLISQWLINR